MLKKIKKMLGKAPGQVSGDPHVLSSGNHPVNPQDISAGAKKVVADLSRAGYEAYVVGGCVRDLLLNLHPKDFDVATDATPEQVKKIFHRARIIGRRFQIVHVRMGPEIIEVTTFRAHHETGKQQKKHGKDKSRHSDKGLLLRDNIFGTINEDASRRDFTMNALYYHPQDDSLYDFANGLKDIKQRTIRIIGNPAVRYREDPVRMLRAVRFGGKLGFKIDAETASPIPKMGKLLNEIPPARLFDECLKLFMNGHALATFHLLREYQLFEKLFPETARALDHQPEPWMLPFLEQALTNTDKRIRSGKHVTPAFLFAALLWPPQKLLSEHYREKNNTPIFAMQRAGGEITSRQCQYISIPKRFSLPMREIWDLQVRLNVRSPGQAERVIENKRFRAGYDFLLLREEAGEIESKLGNWWTDYQNANIEKRQSMANSLQGKGLRSRRRRPRKRPAKPKQPS